MHTVGVTVLRETRINILTRAHSSTPTAQDMKVYIWSQDSPDQEFQYRPLSSNFTDVVWRASWSVTGNVLAVSSGDKVRWLVGWVGSLLSFIAEAWGVF